LTAGQKEKSTLLELYKQGKTIREIAQEVHISFGNIGCIIKKEKGDIDAYESTEQQKGNNNVLLLETKVCLNIIRMFHDQLFFFYFLLL